MARVYLQVFENMIFAFPNPDDHAENIVKELKSWSHELEHH